MQFVGDCDRFPDALRRETRSVPKALPTVVPAVSLRAATQPRASESKLFRMVNGSRIR